MEDRDTDKDWQHIAETDPYWGVLSAEQFKGCGADLDDALIEQFFTSGQSLIQHTLAFIKHDFDPQFSPKRALDFGCGVGRLLVPLARLATQAVGIDVAPRMLDISRANLERFNITNATLVLGDDTLSGVEGTFDFINSYIVFQHIPPSRGYLILESLLSKLDPGGFGSIQLTYAKARQFMQHEIGRAAYYRREGNALIDLVPVRSQPAEGVITMYDYDLNQVMALLAPACGRHITMLPTADDGHLGVHLIFQKRPLVSR